MSPDGADGTDRGDPGGRVVVVTGGGRGLGRSHALLLTAQGHWVVVCDPGTALDGTGPVDPSVAEAVVAQVVAAGGTAVADVEDVGTHDGARAVVDRTLERFGRIDALVHSAGILRDRTFARMSLDDFDEVLRVHVGATTYLTSAAWSALRASGTGRVVLTSSAGGLFGQFGQTSYGTAKTALVGLLNVLRQEGARDGIAVNAIAPVATSRMTEPLLGPDVLAGLDPGHVSGLVAHLASDACRHSGLLLEVGAGLAARVQVMTSAARAVPAAGDDPAMAHLLDELVSLDDHRGYADSLAALERLLEAARAPR